MYTQQQEAKKLQQQQKQQSGKKKREREYLNSFLKSISPGNLFCMLCKAKPQRGEIGIYF